MLNWQTHLSLHRFKQFLAIIVAVITFSSAQAEIITDGSLGTAQELTGPNFTVPAHLGQQVGNNLFHSFDTFNIETPEQATFQGPAIIEQVISRVTGGHSSTINGLLTSEMPHADLYFINPAGVIFGENAQLNIPGSFYVSTADYVKLGDSGRFDAQNPANSTLTIAPPSAFGFLDTSVAPITVDKSYLQVIAPTESIIGAIREGTEIPSNTLALIGGDIEIRGETTVQSRAISQGILLSFAGEIDLVSVASAGEVPLDPLHLAEATFSRLGTIKITDTTAGAANLYRQGNLDTSGPRSGKINIYADKLHLDNAYIFSDTFGDQDGQGINIQVRNDVELENASRITTDVYKLSNFPSQATGNAANSHISAQKITLKDGSQITSQSLALNNDPAQGNGGTITLSAKDQITITGYSQLVGEDSTGRMSSGILTDTRTVGHGGEILLSTAKLAMDDTGEIRAGTGGLGDAGDISLQVGTLELKNGAQINVSTGYLEKNSPIDTGKGGKLDVSASESILITGEKESNRPSGLLSNTFSKSPGGTITLTTPRLSLKDKGTIQASTVGNGGNAGHININTNNLTIQSAFIATESRGYDQSGTISITSPTIQLGKNAVISSKSYGTGNAGNIEINTKNMLLKQSNISTEAAQAEGGNVIIVGGQFLYLSDSRIEVKALGQSTEDGGGGNINLKDTEMLISNQSQLDASAIGGAGGNIHIVADHFLKSADSVLNVTSSKSAEGEINIEASEQDTMDNLVILSTHLLDVSNLLKDSCLSLDITEEADRFVVMPYSGSPPSPDDFQASQLYATTPPISNRNMPTNLLSKLASTGK